MLPPSPFLYPILDANFSSRIIDDAQEILRAGAKIMQLRAKDLPIRAMYDAVLGLCPLFSEKDALLIVNDSVDVAMVTNAGGVHLGQNDFPPDTARAFLAKKIIGYSTHNMEQVAVAAKLAVDYIAIGPVFQTNTKTDADPIIGLKGLQRVREVTSQTLVAIGGIQSSDVPQVLNSGVDGIAMISELYREGSIYDRVSKLLELIDRWNLQNRNVVK